MPSKAIERLRHALVRRSSALARQGDQPGQGLFRMRYSYRSLDVRGEEAHFVAKEGRFEDGRFESEQIEGTLDRHAAFEALAALRGEIEDRVGHLLSSLGTRLSGLRPKR